MGFPALSVLLIILVTCENAYPTGSDEDGFTTDIDWTRLTGTWYLAVSTKFNYWTTLFKCHIFVPYNITDKGMQMYFYHIPVDSGTLGASGLVEDVIFGADGAYTVLQHEKMQWLTPEEEVVHHQKLGDKEKMMADELKWFETHPIHFSTNYETVVYQLKFREGQMGMWIYTRSPHVGADQAVELMNLARTMGANEDLELKGCGDVAPQEYFRS